MDEPCMHLNATDDLSQLTYFYSQISSDHSSRVQDAAYHESDHR